MAGGNFQPLTVFLFIFLIAFIQSAPAETIDDCRVPGDPDILGLGVRLGLYFQIAANNLIECVRPEESADSFLPTGLFFASFLIAVVYSVAHKTFPPGSVISCTWYPLLILAALPVDPLLFLPGHDKGKYGRRAMLFIVLYTGLGFLSLWFWFKGLDANDPMQCMEPRVFFFANFPAYGNIRTLFKVITAIFAGFMPSAFLVAISLLIFKIPKKKQDQRHSRGGDEERVIPLAQHPRSS